MIVVQALGRLRIKALDEDWLRTGLWNRPDLSMTENIIYDYLRDENAAGRRKGKADYYFPYPYRPVYNRKHYCEG